MLLYVSTLPLLSLVLGGRWKLPTIVSQSVEQGLFVFLMPIATLYSLPPWSNWKGDERELESRRRGRGGGREERGGGGYGYNFL